MSPVPDQDPMKKKMMNQAQVVGQVATMMSQALVLIQIQIKRRRKRRGRIMQLTEMEMKRQRSQLYRLRQS